MSLSQLIYAPNKVLHWTSHAVVSFFKTRKKARQYATSVSAALTV